MIYRSCVSLSCVGALAVVPYTGNQTNFKDYFYSLNPSNTNYSQFIDYWQEFFRCQLSDPDSYEPPANLGLYASDDPLSMAPLCPANVSLRTLPINCTCTGDESLDGAPIDVSHSWTKKTRERKRKKERKIKDK